jgi:hypothetical protein
MTKEAFQQGIVEFVTNDSVKAVHIEVHISGCLLSGLRGVTCKSNAADLAVERRTEVFIKMI